MKKTLIIIVLAVVIVTLVFVYINNKKEVNVIVDDTPIVEQYIRDNIKTLAPEKPVLGGSWYVTSVYINPSTKTGDVIYEDGHIQGEAIFTYNRTDNAVTISNISKKK